MAFTLVHPAAVIPLLRKDNPPWVNSSLILGAMAPDFEYYIHLRPVAGIGHTLPGQLVFNLPLVILLTFWFHRIIIPSLLFHLPWVCSWMSHMDDAPREGKGLVSLGWNQVEHPSFPWRALSFKEIPHMIYPALLGMFTHLLWDSFTHHSADLLVQWTDKLMPWIHLPLYSLLQHGSSLLAAWIMLRSFNKNVVIRKGPIRRETIIFWASILVIAILTCVLSQEIPGRWSMERSVVSLISGGFLGISLCCLFYKIKRITFVFFPFLLYTI
jgi:hypothetical protein